MEESKLQEIINQLSYQMPPKPPIKMRVEDYVELLNKIVKLDIKTQEEVLRELNSYQVQLEEMTEKLANRLKEILYKK